MRHLASRIAAAVKSAFRHPQAQQLQDFPLEQLARYPKAWCALLQQAMARSQRGLRQPVLVRRPPAGAAKWRGDRRADKLKTTKLSRRVALRCQTS